MRKFADNSHSWISHFKRLYFYYENFHCLNYTSPLGRGKPLYVNDINWVMEKDNLCLFPSDHGCILQGIYRSEGQGLQAPILYHQSSLTDWKDVVEGTDRKHGRLFSDSGITIEHCASGSSCGYIDTTPDDGDCSGEVVSKQRVNPLAPLSTSCLKNAEK